MNIKVKILILNVIALTLVVSTPIVSAYVASSSSFTLEKDSINFSGTENSSSTLYRMSDTVGEVATGGSVGTSFNLNAGYRAMEASTYITLSSPGDIALSSINQADRGLSEGSATWNVVTNNTNGYRLSIKASTDPALQSSSSSFADYTPTGVVPDYTWSVGATSSEFGFTPEGNDVVSRFLNDGLSICNTGSGNTTSTCWDAFDTTDITIAESSAANNPSGANTLVRVKAEIGSSATQTEGSYSSTLTVTAITL